MHNDLMPLNALYGKGCYRRRILLQRGDRSVVAQLEDDYHAFRLTLDHDGECMTRIEARSLRIPTTACLEAPALLQALVGRPLTPDRLQFRKDTAPRLHCTHLHDLLWLAIAHAGRSSELRLYDIEVPDLQDGVTRVSVQLNGQEVLAWETDLDALLGPAEHAGKPLRNGFSHWVSQEYSGDQLEAAYVLQIAIMVAGARQLDVEAMRAARVQPVKALLGACHAFQADIIGRAIPVLGTVRDFSERPQELLLFK
ncbi:DUF2889 domain-containing protein [Pseudomonas sp. GB2N2]